MRLGAPQGFKCGMRWSDVVTVIPCTFYNRVDRDGSEDAFAGMTHGPSGKRADRCSREARVNVERMVGDDKGDALRLMAWTLHGSNFEGVDKH